MKKQKTEKYPYQVDKDARKFLDRLFDEAEATPTVTEGVYKDDLDRDEQACLDRILRGL